MSTETEGSIVPREDPRYCRYCCGQKTSAPSDTDEYARNKLESGERCHPTIPITGVWVAYEMNQSEAALVYLFATEIETRRFAMDNSLKARWVEFGEKV